jgi:tetratricopeptide (TPR) repeat protein
MMGAAFSFFVARMGSIRLIPEVRADLRSELVRFSRKEWPRYFVLAVLGFIVRLPALPGAMIWDDSYLIQDNPFIKSPLFIFEVFRHYLFLDSYSAHYRPMQNLSFMADYFFWNGNAYGFHLTNVLLHIASGILLYPLLLELFASLRPAAGKIDNNSACSVGAFFVALLWIVHPVHSAAVDYVSGRADSLAFFFACAGWLLFIRARKSSRFLVQTALYTSAAFSGLLALCSRETACIWFALFLFHLFFFAGNLRFKFKVATLVGCLCLIGVYAGLRQLPPPRENTSPSSGWSNPMRAVLMLRALGDYGRLMIYPSNLHMERTLLDPENYQTNATWKRSVSAEYLSIAGLGVLAALLLGTSWRGAGRPARIFGASWFVLGYLPISNLLELNATVAEHWLYLPSVGFLIFVIGCVLDLPVLCRPVVVGCACCAVVALSVRSTIRSSDWSTEEIFYTRTLAAGGRSSRVLANLGQVYANRGEYAKAEAIFRNVLRMSPDYPVARNNLAEVLVREGCKEEAEELLASTTKAAENTRKEYPRTWIAVLNFALSRHREKNDADALVIAEKARHDYPGVWEVIRFESQILQETGRADAAIPLVEAFTRDNWWHYGAALALGRLYAEKGEIAKADAALRHASWLDVHEVEALNLMSMMRVRANKLGDAYAMQRRAVSRQPDEPRQYALLSNILEKLGRHEEARAATAEGSRLETLVPTPIAAN